MSDSIEIIAEIGVNHNGDLQTAFALVNAAKQAGCDTAKFQLYSAERSYASSPYEKRLEMAKLQLDHAEIASLKVHCSHIGIQFLCTPDDIKDAIFLNAMGVERIKIGSSNVTNVPLLKNIATLGMPVILSTGACDSYELERAVGILEKIPLTIMHCVSAYPAPVDQMNLLVIRQLYERFHHPMGLSDHTVGAAGRDVAIAALALGARVFEKHFTLNRNQRGPDHATSLEPYTMSNYVGALRLTAKALGTGVKQLMPCEMANRAEYDRFVGQQVR